MSNLHLIHWAGIIVDHHQQFHHLRCGTARGDSITRLNLSEPSLLSVASSPSWPKGKIVSILDRIDREYWSQSSGSVLIDVSQLLGITSYNIHKNHYQFK